MNRKDTIIIAVLLNVVVLAVLFVTAVNTEDEQISEASDLPTTVVITEEKSDPLPIVQKVTSPPVVEEKFDLLLGDLDSDEDDTLLHEDEWTLFADGASEPTPLPSEISARANIVEITVKKGDSLDKIAKSNNSTIESIKRINSLKTDRLKIGQKLQVDVGSNQKTASVDRQSSTASSNTNSNVEFYTLKSGDSPWKIARQFHVNMDELLRLNNLDEEKARNLKVGDKIRVR